MNANLVEWKVFAYQSFSQIRFFSSNMDFFFPIIWTVGLAAGFPVKSFVERFSSFAVTEVLQLLPVLLRYLLLNIIK